MRFALFESTLLSVSLVTFCKSILACSAAARALAISSFAPAIAMRNRGWPAFTNCPSLTYTFCKIPACCERISIFRCEAMFATYDRGRETSSTNGVVAV